MQLTTNTRAFIESEQYSQFTLLTLHDGLLPETFYRNVTDFSTGSTLHIKTIGSVTIQEAAEDVPLIYSPIETGEITLSMTDYIGDAWYVTDDLREDGTNIPQLMAQRAAESTRAIQENFETRLMAVTESGQTDLTPNTINGFPHRVVSAEVNNVFSLDHLIGMKIAFNKANVPSQGRVFLCDSVVEATLNKLITITSSVTPFAEAILKEGLASGQKFVMELFGWTIITSNRLPKGTYSDGTTSVTGVANLFMCVSDDQTKPVMVAWRRMPKTEGERNVERGRDEFTVRARWGMGVQRVDTLGVLVTSDTAY